jgi:hypothetical protein
MATTFKNLLSTDIATTRTLLNEAIPLTGTIVSGTYDEDNPLQTNIKYYTHGMFESVYDYPYLSSSANRIFDLTYGYNSATSGTHVMNAKKMNIYSQLSLVLNGAGPEGQILNFDRDGDLLGTTTDSMNACFFIPYARLLTKDEIKKGSYTLSWFSSSTTPGFGKTLITVGDYGAATEYRVNSPAGEYGLLYTSSAPPVSSGASSVGHLYYQAGIAVITASGDLFQSASNYITTMNITSACNDLRSEWNNNSYNNTTELNSTIYFCQANAGEFNFSANPTYLTASAIRVKGGIGGNPSAQPKAYITTIGLYSPDNELLAVAKLSEPIQKDPSNSLVFRVRLDY